jgi:imidazole glycerol-phosphate synthase subunit HisH
VPDVAIVDYGSGNLHSVARAVARVGGDPRVTGDPLELASADALVIPGVGHFGQCVRVIRERGLAASIEGFVASGRQVVGVCVGMQIMFEGSDEDDEPGLGMLLGRVRRLPSSVKVPHMGWNTVEQRVGHPFLAGIPDGERFYFVHSYAPEPGVGTVGVTEHGRPFAAAVARDNVFAMQFHPEKSGEAGLQIYENIVKALT